MWQRLAAGAGTAGRDSIGPTTGRDSTARHARHLLSRFLTGAVHGAQLSRGLEKSAPQPLGLTLEAHALRKGQGGNALWVCSLLGGSTTVQAAHQLMQHNSRGRLRSTCNLAAQATPRT